MELLICLALPLLLFLLITYPFISHWRKNRPQDLVWSEIASWIGSTLTYLPGRQRMFTGAYRGRDIIISTFSTRGSFIPFLDFSLMDKNTSIILSLQVPCQETELEISREDFAAKIGKRLGEREVQIGDDEFDKRFFIRSNPENLAGQVFNRSTLRSRLINAPVPDFRFDGEDLRWTCVGVVENADYMKSVINLLSSLMDSIEEAIGRDPSAHNN